MGYLYNTCEIMFTIILNFNMQACVGTKANISLYQKKQFTCSLTTLITKVDVFWNVAPGGFIDIINVSGKHTTSIFDVDVEPSVEKSGDGYKERENW
jgi:hypothetical protein